MRARARVRRGGAVLVLSAALLAGCRGAPAGGPRLAAPEEVAGEVLYRNVAKGRDVLVVLSTDPASPRLDLLRRAAARTSLGRAPEDEPQAAGGLVHPADLGDLLGRLEAVGLFALPGLVPAPEVPPEGAFGIVVARPAGRFAVVRDSLETPAEVQTFQAAQRLIIAAQMRALPPPARRPSDGPLPVADR